MSFLIAKHEGRTYNMTAVTHLTNLSDELWAKERDGGLWHGISESPTKLGRRFYGLFERCAKSGKFHCVVCVELPCFAPEFLNSKALQ